MARDVKNKNGSLHLHNGLQFLTIINLNGRVYFVTFPRHLMEPYAFLSGKLEKYQWTHPRP